MPPSVGPILRILGLLLEFLGITILMLSGREGGMDVGARLGTSHEQVWGVVIAGFLVWAVGTLLIYARGSRPRREKGSAGRRDDEF